MSERINTPDDCGRFPFIKVTRYECGFAVETREQHAKHLGFDEAAYFFSCAWFGKPTPDYWDENPLRNIRWQLLAFEEQSDLWTITNGSDRFIGQLCENEAFGFLLHYMATEQALFSGLRTCEEQLPSLFSLSAVKAHLIYIPTPICCRPLT